MTAKDNIEERLRQAIVAAGVSRYRLSAMSGVSDGVLSHFVNRQRSITMTTAAKIADALDLELMPKKRRESR